MVLMSYVQTDGFEFEVEVEFRCRNPVLTSYVEIVTLEFEVELGFRC